MSFGSTMRFMRTGQSDGCNPLGAFAGAGVRHPNWTGRPGVDPVMYAPRAIAGATDTEAWEQRVRAAGRPVDATGLTAVWPRLPHTPCEWFGPDVEGNVYECGRGFGSTLAGAKRKLRPKAARKVCPPGASKWNFTGGTSFCVLDLGTQVCDDASGEWQCHPSPDAPPAPRPVGVRRRKRSRKRGGFMGWCPCKGRPPGL